MQGSNQTITLPDFASLDGTVTDDGLPSGTVTTMWSKVSGSGTVTFGNASAVDTTATFSQADTYVLRLTADDGVLMNSADVTITVNPVPPINQPPMVDAGASQTITLPTFASLDGTVTDDGLPSGTVTTTWAKVSGSGTVTFGNASSVDTTASFSLPGTYVLRLTADDGALTTSAEVTITVDPNPTTFTCDGPSLAGSYSGVVEGKRNSVPYSAFLFLTVVSNGTLDVLSIFGEPGAPWQQEAGAGTWTPFFTTDGFCIIMATVPGGTSFLASFTESGDAIQLSTPNDPQVQAAGGLRRAGS